MSEIPLSEIPRIGKITKIVSTHICEDLTRKLGISLEEPPILDSKWSEEGDRRHAWKYVTDLKPNIVIQLHLKLKDYPYSEVTGLINGVTIDNLLYLKIRN